MINLGLYGSSGRMGQEIISCLTDSKIAKISATYNKNDCNSKSLDDFFLKSDVIVDFSSELGTFNLLKFAENNPKPLMIGTTGLNDEIYDLIKKLSANMPILQASNTSLGICVLDSLVKKASEILRNFDIEICETHHRFKKDSPSGTALSLAKSAASVRHLKLEDVIVTSRNSQRKKDEISVVSLRGGDVAGIHSVGFYDDGEFLELKHSASSRKIFAKGAISAAIWLFNAKNGLYDMQDCLGIK